MNIVFKKVDINNFLSIGNATVELDNRGFVRVIGKNNNEQDNALSNGSGKSSVFDAIVWALTGETVRGVTNSVSNTNTNEGALVSLDFDCDGVAYSITRTREHSVYKNSLTIKINGVDKSGKGIRESEKILSEYLPDLTENLIGSVVVLGQGLPKRFTNNTPSGRKELLETLTKSDYMIEDLKNRVTNRKDELKESLNELDKQLDNAYVRREWLATDIDECENELGKLGDIEELTEQKKERESAIEEYEKSQKDLQEVVNNAEEILNNYRDEYSQLFSRKSEDEKRSEELNKELFNLRMEINSVEVKISSSNKELTKLSASKDICPTCGQKIISLSNKIENNINELKESVVMDGQHLVELREKESVLSKSYEEERNRIGEKYDKEISSIVAKGNEAREFLLDAMKNKNLLKSAQDMAKETIYGIQAKIDAAKANRKTFLDRIKKNNEEISKLDEKVSYLNIEIEKVRDKIKFISSLATYVCRDFRGYLLQNAISYIDSKAKAYSETLFNGSCVSMTLDGNSVDISYNDREYEALSGGEKQKADIIIQFALRDMLCSYLNFDCNMLVIDEVFDNLDAVGCKGVINLISSLNTISSVFIITHHGDELSIPYDEELLVTKNKDGVSEVKNN